MTDGNRNARVDRDPNGNPVGCAVFLTARQLRDLGFDPRTTDAIEYSVEDGNIRLTEPTFEEVVE